MVFSCLVLLMCLFAFPFPHVVSKSTIRNSETNSYKGALLNEVQLITFSRNLRLNELLEFRPCDIILMGSNYRDVLVEPSTLQFYVGGSFGLNFIDGSRSKEFCNSFEELDAYFHFIYDYLKIHFGVGRINCCGVGRSKRVHFRKSSWQPFRSS